MRWWKVLGLAGLAGVAASGVVIARGERQRRAYTPEEIRSRLHERVAAVGSSHGESDGPGIPEHPRIAEDPRIPKGTAPGP